ncbi:type II secretion system F family protein [Sutcliffiella horikoshii]|uniref:type II secretion system F family protein n=1 Tax=Sutcliffiella horikoshii TaxID=79883 RepID=UPI00165392C8|nr:type II secretion system F family protein [Sutcliffiella horikoshii]
MLLSNSLTIADEKEKKKKLAEKSKVILGMGNLLEGNFQFKNLRQQLIYAGYEIGPGEYLVRTILLAGILSGIIYLIMSSLLISAFSFFLGFVIRSFLLKRAIRIRNQLATQQLIQALGIMANSLRAGYSFLQVIKLISEESPKPLGKEFGKVIQNVNLGLSLEESFEQLKTSFNNPDLEMVLTSILIQRESGGDLSRLLESIQETMIGRMRVKDEVRTLTAQGRLSMWVIMFVPVGIALYLQVVNPDYFHLMFQHILGWVMIFMAISGVLLGWFIINKIVSIEV